MAILDGLFSEKGLLFLPVRNDSRIIGNMNQWMSSLVGGDKNWLGRQLKRGEHEADTNVESPTQALWKAGTIAALLYGGGALAGESGAGAGATAETGVAAGADTTAAAGTTTAAADVGYIGVGSTPAAGAGAGVVEPATPGLSQYLSQYATVSNAQKLYSGLQLAQALTAPKVPGAAPPPKASQTPGLQNARGNLSGGAPGVASTFLTGTAGVDPSLLNLGRSTLLGG